MLDISLRLFLVLSQFDQLINQTIYVEHTFIVLDNLCVMTDIP